MDCSPPDSSVHKIFQARILEGLPFPPPGDFSDPGIEPESLMSPALAGGFITTSTTRVYHSVQDIQLETKNKNAGELQVKEKSTHESFRKCLLKLKTVVISL